MTEWLIEALHSEETSFELSLRPTMLKQYIGQSSIKQLRSIH